MKIANRKNNLLKFTKILIVGALMSLGLKASAQCTAGFTYTVDTANNGNVTFANTSSGSTTLYYSWNFGDGTSDNSMTPATHNYNGSGTYNVCLSIHDSLALYDSTLGCINTYCTTITVINNFATCHALFSMSSDTAAGGVHFGNGSSGVITNYLWNFGDGTTDTSSNPPPHTYTSGGIYHICLTTSNPATLCNSTYCDSISISGCYAAFTYVADAVGNGCTFSGSSTGTGNTYSWDFGDGSTSSLQNPYHIFPANGSYHVCLSTSSTTDSTCHNTTCHDVYMSGVCHAGFSIGQDSSDLYSFYIYDYSTSPSGSLTYLWNFGDGTTSTLQYPSHTYTSATPVWLCLTIDDGAGCTDTYCDSIIPGVLRSGTFTVTVLATGIHEQTSVISSLENYPNPFTNSTTISYSIKQNAIVELSVSDLLGNKITVLESGNKSSGDYKTNWNAENISGGIYLLQLKVNNQTLTKKLVITK